VAKRSAFRDFIAALRRDWRSGLPGVLSVRTALGAGGGMSVPRASTFYAGLSRDLGMHVFVYFQHSTKSWEVGQFTANVILSRHENAPEVWFRLAPEGGGEFAEGCYRLGPLLGQGDKWWCLERGGSRDAGVWRAASYDDPAQVVSEAIADVTRDVRAILGRFRVESANPDAEPGAAPDPAN
jgi:hypothetical protein